MGKNRANDDRELARDLRALLRILKQNRRNRVFWPTFRPELVRLKHAVDDVVAERFEESGSS